MIDPVDITVGSGRAALAVSTWGDTGEPLVALHPGVADRRVWGRCAPVWAAEGLRVVAYDRRGFGDTLAEEEPHDDLADLLAVTAATAARPAVLVGNSRGGGLALDLALAHADHVRALVLIAPSPSGYPYERWESDPAEVAQDQLIEDADQAGDLDLVNRLEVRYWLDGITQPEGRVAGSARALMLDMNGRALRADPIGAAVEPPPAWPELQSIEIPTLVVAGEYDLPGMSTLCVEVTNALPRAELVTLQAAHCPSLDEPEELNRVVLEFLATLR